MSAIHSHLASRSIAAFGAVLAVAVTAVGIAAGVQGVAAQPVNFRAPQDARVLYGCLQQPPGARHASDPG